MSTHHHHHHNHNEEYHHPQHREHEQWVSPNNGFQFQIGRENNKLSHSFVEIQPNPNPNSNPTSHENVYETSGMLSEMFNFGPLTNTPSDPLLPNPINPNPNSNIWGGHMNSPPELGGVIEGQGLSLSLSSSLQQTQEFRSIGTGGDHGLFFKSLAGPTHEPSLHNLHDVSAFGSIQQQVQMGLGSSLSSVGVVNVLRSSKYAKPAQELLEEFCSVGRAHLKKHKLGTHNSSKPNPNSSDRQSDGGGLSSSKKETLSPLSSADRSEHQRRKVKLLSMLDEVERRYNHYCEQMQMMVNSFDMVMGFGSAAPYTALAQTAMSRHFKCLKEAIQAQLRQSCELLGDKDPSGGTGLTKGETPRLKMLEHSLRQQRVFHQVMGIVDQSEAWRPQRGLPERSVTILRAWLFEHFLHPYPSDADKHLLARQTGLSRNQVSNWFINARVRLWKPMIEDMYQQESKEDDEVQEDGEEEQDRDKKLTSTMTTKTNNNNSNSNPTTKTTNTQQHHNNEAQNPIPSSSSSLSAPHNHTHALTAKRSAGTMTRVHVAPPHHDNYHHQLPANATATLASSNQQAFFGDTDDMMGPTTMIRFGSPHASGDVSLTLGLRHAGNNGPDKTPAFSLGDFGSC